MMVVQFSLEHGSVATTKIVRVVKRSVRFSLEHGSVATLTMKQECIR